MYRSLVAQITGSGLASIFVSIKFASRFPPDSGCRTGKNYAMSTTSSFLFVDATMDPGSRILSLSLVEKNHHGVVVFI
jgi:hypothetical protein